jgi:chromosome segregation ATPase
MNKNRAIFILVVLIFIGGIWGSLADRKKIALEKQLNETVGQMQKLTEQSSRQREQVLGKTAGLQETLAKNEEQLGKARKELVSLRKESQALESKLSGCNVTIQKIRQEKEALVNEMRAAQVTDAEKTPGTTEQKLDGSSSQGEKGSDEQINQPGVEGKIAANDVPFLQEQILTAELTIDRLQQRLDAEKAQMMGLEKLLEEKNSAMEETSQDMDRLKINMDVLLSKIADQRDDLQEIQEENRDLIKELAAKNEEIADLQEEVMRQPVQE